MLQPAFPTVLHKQTAETIHQYFSVNAAVDTVLVVNSCARGHAVAESDLDFAILAKENISASEIEAMEKNWLTYSTTNTTIINFKQSGPFAHIHLDIIKGIYKPNIIEVGEPCDDFEIEIGNQVCYSAPMGKAGTHYKDLQKKWLPYYDEALRVQRLEMVVNACNYDLDHIAFFIKRDLYFQAFDILCKAFKEYLQALFIACRTYPIAYNKWIRLQVADWLNKPGLYALLPPILSVSNIEGMEIIDNVKMLRTLLNNLAAEKYLPE